MKDSVDGTSKIQYTKIVMVIIIAKIYFRDTVFIFVICLSFIFQYMCTRKATVIELELEFRYQRRYHNRTKAEVVKFNVYWQNTFTNTRCLFSFSLSL